MKPCPIPALLALAAVLSATPATAQTAPDTLVTAEVLGGWRTAEGTQMAGLRLVLAPGWKTYWRAPGEAGIPPVADWSGSSNVQGVRFHWPVPQVFELSGMRTLGYSGEVVLPMEVAPRDAADGVGLSGEIAIGVCAEVCVPVTLRLDAPLPMPGAPDSAIRAALNAVPERVSPPLRCQVEPLRDGLRLTAVIDLRSLGAGEMAVIEAGDPSVWVSEAMLERTAGQLTVSADLVPASAQPFALDRGAVTITLLGGGTAVEIRGCPAG